MYVGKGAKPLVMNHKCVFEIESEVTQSCPTLCDPMDCGLPGFSAHGFSKREHWNGCHFFVQGIFLTYGWNLPVLHLLPAAAAAKSLQSCPILCNPIDGSPPGSPVLGILQARTLE